MNEEIIKKISNLVDEFYTINPKFRTKKKLKEFILEFYIEDKIQELKEEIKKLKENKNG